MKPQGRHGTRPQAIAKPWQGTAPLPPRGGSGQSGSAIR